MEQNQILSKDVLEFTEFNIADLIILDLSRNHLKRSYPEIIDDQKYLEMAKTILEKAYSIAKSDAFCCVISNDDKDSDTAPLKSFGTVIIDDDTQWYVTDEIIWVKNAKKQDFQTDSDSEITIEFTENPFSQIWVLAKGKSSSKNRSMFLEDVQMSQSKKSQLLDSMWFIQPTSISSFKDWLPGELLSRLILCYSKENELVLDPFAGHCLSAIVCKFLKRNFLCLTNSNELQIAKNRFNDGESYNE